ncbi:hypothetical protein GTO89_06495 [Heliobacterium gestii]|uniref:PIG-L family deacetylase n=1 Tax=Heliomicrobium gestii TaxID=2699 RepID=A0A845L7J4_HELGE|nr:PIG-L family deacetylase [Heliomicrobium gestii]MBM7865980.1 LmbE family N-acetylglucosaminyl deacetylase [Heliomicrobium gestii]MZP42687.1 hypothetical protein [Heliomicrobium gestii]
MIETGRLMAILAHPDDESFCIGGTLAKYAAQGVETTLICATRGEAGKCGEPPICRPDELGSVREAELRRAAEVLQIGRVEFLPYRDKELNGVDEKEIVARLVGLIRRHRPQVLITFGPDGLTCHPDHVAISRFATAAACLAPAHWAYPEEGAPWRPGRFFYTGMPCSYINAFGVSHCVPRADSEVSAAIPVGPYLRQKRAAIRCHRTQSRCIRELERLTDPTIRSGERMRHRDWEFFFDPFAPTGAIVDDLFETPQAQSTGADWPVGASATTKHSADDSVRTYPEADFATWPCATIHSPSAGCVAAHGSPRSRQPLAWTATQ